MAAGNGFVGTQLRVSGRQLRTSFVLQLFSGCLFPFRRDPHSITVASKALPSPPAPYLTLHLAAWSLARQPSLHLHTGLIPSLGLCTCTSLCLDHCIFSSSACGWFSVIIQATAQMLPAQERSCPQSSQPRCPCHASALACFPGCFCPLLYYLLTEISFIC